MFLIVIYIILDTEMRNSREHTSCIGYWLVWYYIYFHKSSYSKPQKSEGNMIYFRGYNYLISESQSSTRFLRVAYCLFSAQW
jgi:hypothetical protein